MDQQSARRVESPELLSRLDQLRQSRVVKLPNSCASGVEVRRSERGFQVAPTVDDRLEEVVDAVGSSRLMPGVAPRIGSFGHLQGRQRIDPLRFQQALLDLSLLVAANVDPHWLDRHNDRNSQTVFNALAWYDEHMGEAPGVDALAMAAGVSSSHLRRLFHSVMERSPLEAIKSRQLERARFLLRTTSLTVEEIGQASGFQSLSSFSRSFKQQIGLAPQYWRSTQAATDRRQAEVRK